MRVFEQFVDGASSIAVTDIADGRRFPVTSTYRFIENLVTLRYLEPDLVAGRFRPGPQMIRLGLNIVQNLDLRRLALPTMESLAAATGESVTLSVLQGDRGICIAAIASSQRLRASRDVGEVFPLHAGASARVLLAYSPDPEALIRRMKLEKFTAATPTNQAAVAREIPEVRRVGYAISDGEVAGGTVGIAAAVFDHLERMVGALGLMAVKSRVTNEKMHEFVGLLRAGAQELSERLSTTAAPPAQAKDVPARHRRPKSTTQRVSRYG